MGTSSESLRDPSGGSRRARGVSIARWAMLAGVWLVVSHILEKHGLEVVTFVARQAWGDARAAQDEGQKAIRTIAHWAPEVAYWTCGFCLLAGALFGRDRV